MTSALQRTAAAFDPPFAVGGLAILVFAWWAGRGAGYAPVTWYTGALFLAGLVLVVFLAGAVLSPSRPVLVALASLGAFAAWCALSITWSSDRGIAWDGANRTFLYLLVYASFACLPWRRESIPALLCLFSLAVLGIGVTDLARSIGNTGSYFLNGRLAAPAGYPNAACALFMLAFWPLAYIAARREPPPLIRGLLLAASTVLVELALLAQSRGSLVAVPIAALVYLVVVPQRLRAGTALAAVATTTFLVRGRILHVFDAVRLGEGADSAIRSALATLGLTALAVFVVWSVVAVIDRRVELSNSTRRVAGLVAMVLVGAGLLIGAVALATANPGPRERLGDAWRHFKAGYPEEQGGSHFTIGLGSNRYDFWRVSVDQFRDHPLRGAGVDNFADDYTLERRSTEEPLYPHSLLFRIPAQTGIVGSLLFAAFLAAAAIAAWRGTANMVGFPSGVARAAIAAAAYFAIHASGDWLWEFAGLGAPAFAWLGLAASRREPARPPVAALRLATAVATLCLAASFAFPWLAELRARQAVHEWNGAPGAAFADLAAARRLNPLSSRADLLAGAIASRVGDLGRMRAAFARASERDPRNWFAHFELAVAEAGLGQRRLALHELAVARELNPREELIPSVRRTVEAGESIDRRRLDQTFVERVRLRVGGS